jgi:HEAT repeat protein
MQALDLPLLRIHAEEMVPLLLALLVNDSNPAVREQAAMRLVAFDSITADGKLRAGTQANQRLQALQHAARTDPAPNVRLAAANSIQCIQSALSGRVNAD